MQDDLLTTPTGGDSAFTANDVNAGELVPARSQLALRWRRFQQDRAALAGLALLAFMALLAVAAPLITPGATSDTSFLDSFPLIPGVAAYAPTMDHFPAGVMGYFGPAIPPFQPNGPASFVALKYHSVLTVITFGARITLTSCLIAAGIAALIGLALGMISGYFGGFLDDVLMRLADIVLSFPFLPLVVALVLATHQLTASLQSIVIIFALAGWPPIARITRAEYLRLREQPYAEAAIAVGVNDRRIMLRHLLPNAIGPVLITIVTLVSGLILAEVALDYIYLGVIDIPTWGNAIAFAQFGIEAGNWWAIFFPGLAVVLTVVALTFIADGIRAAFNVNQEVR
jgi:peptide/nickel transport system permease protein